MRQPKNAATSFLPILLFVSVAVATIPAFPAYATGPWEGHTTGASWALGVTVPNGAALCDGGSLSWSEVRNLTVVVKLPSISWTDDTIYAILSAMTSDGAVLQVAAGIYPNQANWSVYALYIINLEEYPQTYFWVANNSVPYMQPGDRVSLSLFFLGNQGRYAVTDLNTGEASGGKMTDVPRPMFKVGDQEVFALEAYTFNSSVFEGMERLVLEEMLVDGRSVAGGWYYTGGWDPAHKPLFVAGGYDPPSFIYMLEENGFVVWGYGSRGLKEYSPPSLLPLAGMAVVLAIIGGMAVALDAWTRKKKEKTMGRFVQDDLLLSVRTYPIPPRKTPRPKAMIE